MIILLSYMLNFSSLAKALFASILMAFTHISTPTIKYGLNFYNPFDTFSHIRFMTFISEHGRIPHNEEVYYASLYEYTPLGNGVLPAILDIFTQFGSFQTYLTIFILFTILLLMSFFMIISDITQNIRHDLLGCRVNYKESVWYYGSLILIVSTLYLPEWFASPVFAFIPLSFLASLMVKNIFIRRSVERRSLMIYIVLFLYVSLSHLSTSLYLLIFLIFTSIVFLSFTTINVTVTNNIREHHKKQNTLIIRTILTICTIFVTFSLLQHLYYNFASQEYINYYYKKIFEGEFETPTEFSSFRRNPDILRTFLFLLGAYGKLALNLMIQAFLTVVVLIKIFKSKSSIDHLDLFSISLLFSSNILVFLTYFVFFRRFEDLTRQIIFVEPMILAVLYHYVNRGGYSFVVHKTLITDGFKAIPLLLVLISSAASLLMTSNYGLPQVVQPTCVNDEICFRPIARTYVITSQAVTSVEFVGKTISDEYGFTLLITNLFPRNYFDLFWNEVEKQELMLDIYYPEKAGQTIKRVLLDKQNFLLFMPQSFKYVPSGPLDYDEPLKVLNMICSQTMNVIYNNGGIYVYVK